MRMTGDDPDEAFDLSQRAFLRVLDKLDSFRGDSALATWVHRVAVNEALQHIRRKKRHRKITDELALSQERSAPMTEDHGSSIDVRAAIEQLPERLQNVICLRYERGMAYAEIAKKLGVEQGTVASGLHRARRPLAGLLRGYGKVEYNEVTCRPGGEHGNAKSHSNQVVRCMSIGQP